MHACGPFRCCGLVVFAPLVACAAWGLHSAAVWLCLLRLLLARLGVRIPLRFCYVCSGCCLRGLGFRFRCGFVMFSQLVTCVAWGSDSVGFASLRLAQGAWYGFSGVLQLCLAHANLQCTSASVPEPYRKNVHRFV